MSWFLLPSGMPFEAVDATNLAARLAAEGATPLADVDVPAAITAWNNRATAPAKRLFVGDDTPISPNPGDRWIATTP